MLQNANVFDQSAFTKYYHPCRGKIISPEPKIDPGSSGGNTGKQSSSKHYFSSGIVSPVEILMNKNISNTPLQPWEEGGVAAPAFSPHFLQKP